MSGPSYYWEKYSDEELLDLKFSDLGLKLQGSWVEKYILRLYDELERKGMRFRPHFWISTEWFCPDGVPGIAIPFFLIHPRLKKLEESMMLDVEGGTADWCMRVLRHETGHAIDNAYRLRRVRERQKLFGLSSTPYPESYAPRAYSRRYVVNLDSWYAQSHPDEDWAETFAVWLNPKSAWKKHYADWPALRKLEMVETLMSAIADRPASVRNKLKVEPVHRIHRKLGPFYKKRRAQLGVDNPAFFDLDLYRLFSSDAKYSKRKTAAQFIRENRHEIRAQVSRWTGQYQYTVNELLDEIIDSCSKRKLRLTRSERQTKLDFIGMLTAQTVTYMMNGQNRIYM